MAHLTCVEHGRRVHLSDSVPGAVMHHDSSRCQFDGLVTINGHQYVPSVVVINRERHPLQLKAGDPVDQLDEFPLPPKSRKERPRRKRSAQ